MDCAPLNLAHFHERRAEKLMRKHNYDEAHKAIETSLIYLQDAYKNMKIPKSIEVLNSQKWDYERKLQQIDLRKQQHERMKLKEIIPQQAILQPQQQQQDNTILTYKLELANAQSIARSIDKTVKEFNEKYGSTNLIDQMEQLEIAKIGPETQINVNKAAKDIGKDANKENSKQTDLQNSAERKLGLFEENMQLDDELPSLAPLELPSFDYSVFMSSGLSENFQK